MIRSFGVAVALVAAALVSGCAGVPMAMPVLLDNAPIGDTASKTYLYRQIAPGPHVVTAKTEGDSTVSIDAKPGATYFVWQEVKMGMMKGRSELHLVDEATGKAGVAECKLVQ